MSAPDPAKWQITQDEMDTIDSGVDMYGVESEEVQGPICAVARRRAIEELKALAKDMCVHCAAGVEFVRLSDNIGQWSGHAHNPSDLWDCDALALHDRIAAIEAEEA